MDLEALRARLREISAEMETLTTEGEMTDEQAARFDELSAEFDRVSADIKAKEREARVAETRAALDQTSGRRVPPRVRVSGGEPTAEYLATGGFDSLASFAQSVRAAGPGKPMDDRLTDWIKAAPSTYHQEGVGADGGYAVPPRYAERIWSVVYEDDGLLDFIAPEPTDFNTVTEPTDESTPWGTSGIYAQWRSEGSQMTPTKLNLKENDVKLHELYAFVLATEELLADAPRLENRLTVKAGEAIRWKAGEAIVNGNGVGRPLGWFGAAAEVVQAKVAGQTADTINATNVVSMFSRCLNVGTAAWLINPDAYPQLPLMSIGNSPVWVPPSTGLKGATGGTLLGRPVLMSEHCQTLGDKGDIQLISPNGYLALQKRGGPQYASSIHLYFDYNISAFRWTFRLGGQPHMSAPITPPNSSVTRSHFVQLAARA